MSYILFQKRTVAEFPNCITVSFILSLKAIALKQGCEKRKKNKKKVMTGSLSYLVSTFERDGTAMKKKLWNSVSVSSPRKKREEKKTPGNDCISLMARNVSATWLKMVEEYSFYAPPHGQFVVFLF